MTSLDPRPAMEIGASCPPVRVRPDEVQLFRFSAITWNAHRIHFDQAYARSEGYDGVLVQAHLHGAYLAGAALEWSGDDARLIELEWQNRAPAVAGDDLAITGTVTDTWITDGDRHVVFAMEERKADDTLIVRGSATTVLPAAGHQNRGSP